MLYRNFSLVIVAATIALEFSMDEGSELAMMVVILTVIGALVLHSRYVEQENTTRLKEAYKQAALAAGVKSDFLAVMSHELRTPLTAIMGYSEILLDGCVGPMVPEQAEMLERIDASSKHLLLLIQQVLDISRAERGKLEMQVDRFDICELVKRTVTILNPIASKKGLTLHVNVPRNRCLAESDMGKLRQIIVSLVGNAIKFTNEGSVTVELLPNHSTFMLKVRDTGIGIPLEEQGMVFEPFYQVGGSIYNRSKEGAGLGLTICREITLLMNGSIECESKPDAGTVFTVILPRVVQVSLVA